MKIIYINDDKFKFKNVEPGDLFAIGRRNELYLKIDKPREIITGFEAKNALGLPIDCTDKQMCNAISIRTGIPLWINENKSVKEVKKIIAIIEDAEEDE